MISVIIPSYNSENTVRECLDSLQNQTYNGEYEIILVDSSQDSTLQIVSSEYKNINLIHLDNKTDPGTARNLGVKRAKGDLIAFIDSDCIAANDWLERIMLAHESSYGVIGGSVSRNNQEDDLVGLAGYIAEFREFLPELPGGEVEHLPTCNLSFKKRIFNEYGLFRGEYYPQEDRVYNYYLRKKGEKILFNPAIRVFHQHRSRLKEFLLHQKRIGDITARVLKVIKIQGAFITRNPVLAILFMPFFPMVKFIRTVSVFLRYQPQAITKKPLVLALFALGLMYWSIGFSNGAYKKTY